ncbi:hypothetical protein NUW58_g2225 [Xylaria curta]|uniref:Uncharacterized protein n=1 Tax=Xylaria curta TaxID=42375 RepID=A0ACC1PGR3_9PEZI|nr:hypothetical protein NUW58_g2225 [Xylaria curta]
MISLSAFASALLLLLIQQVNGAGDGIIGFGLSIFPDSCCLACHDSLSSLYLSCTTFAEHADMPGMDSGMEMGTTTEECRTSNMPWLQTMAYCIQQACGAQGYTMEKQAGCFSLHAVAGASEPTFHGSLPVTAPTVELPEDATWLNATSLYELDEYVGNRTGMLSLVNLSIAILFAGRNNILIGITGWSQTTFLAFHRWAARVATLQAIVHSIVYTLAYTDPGYDGAPTYAEKAAEPFYWWGIIGTIALSLAIIFAVLPLRIALYELFLTIHIILIILSLIACWYHLVPHFGFKIPSLFLGLDLNNRKRNVVMVANMFWFSQYGYQVWLYICFAFWSADRLARLARIVYYNRLGDAKAIVEAVPGSNVLHITVFPRVTRGIGPGQHTFLYFPGLGKFWESHPFSIAAWETRQSPIRLVHLSNSTSKSNGVHTVEEEYNYQVKPTVTPHQEAALHESHKYNDVSFQLLVRAHSGMTAALQRHLSLPSTASRVEVSAYTEGYYAGHHATLQPLFAADTVLCLVGGAGITHALSFVQEYVSGVSPEGEDAGKARGIMKRTKRFILAWSAKEMAFISYVKKNFLANAQGVECFFWYTGSSEDAAQKSESLKSEIVRVEGHAPMANVKAGRMHIGSVIKSSLEAGRQTTVLVCGPGQMADEARRQVINYVKEGFSVDLVEEAFAW